MIQTLEHRFTHNTKLLQHFTTLYTIQPISILQYATTIYNTSHNITHACTNSNHTKLAQQFTTLYNNLIIHDAYTVLQKNKRLTIFDNTDLTTNATLQIFTTSSTSQTLNSTQRLQHLTTNILKRVYNTMLKYTTLGTTFKTLQNHHFQTTIKRFYHHVHNSTHCFTPQRNKDYKTILNNTLHKFCKRLQQFCSDNLKVYKSLQVKNCIEFYTCYTCYHNTAAF